MKTSMAKSVSLGVVLCASAGYAFSAECGDVTIASMNWQSAELLANIDKIILSKGYSCNAQLITGDTVPTLTSMAEKGKPDIAPEAAINLAPTVIERGLSEKRLIATVNVLPDGYVEGWWIPKYIADAHPEIKTIADALKQPKLFPAPEDPSKGAVYNGPQGWGSTVITGQLFKGNNAKNAGFTLVATGSAAALDGSLIKAYQRKQGWLGYYWAPTALLGKYKMVKLRSVPHDAAEWKRCTTVADCPNPKPNDWPAQVPKTLVTTDFAKRAGPAIDYLKARSFSNAEVNKVLAWMTDNQASGEDAAKRFLKERESVWTKWVPAAVAAKVKAAL
ncbi:ABC transporter substrate-binding protein [Pseudogulbenkiania sp. MAI-1]|uniref:ABC transporter substrate-binding protein n=1 Tax=Pseudogulbenkiania sp. MAI-1 TaxID=990370 RepID=UPI00045E75C2|nr:ABC transporter substrate-binding protein [Pseudogulbenkiania sp. MAI-1]